MARTPAVYQRGNAVTTLDSLVLTLSFTSGLVHDTSEGGSSNRVQTVLLSTIVANDRLQGTVYQS